MHESRHDRGPKVLSEFSLVRGFSPPTLITPPLIESICGDNEILQSHYGSWILTSLTSNPGGRNFYKTSKVILLCWYENDCNILFQYRLCLHYLVQKSYKDKGKKVQGQKNFTSTWANLADRSGNYRQWSRLYRAFSGTTDFHCRASYLETNCLD